MEASGTMLYEKSNWDYFCELLAVIPGMSAMFDDSRGGYPLEASPKETYEAEKRLRERGELSGDKFESLGDGFMQVDEDEREPSGEVVIEDGLSSMGESLGEGARSAAEAVRTGAEKVGEAVKDGLENAREYIRERF